MAAALPADTFYSPEGAGGYPAVVQFYAHVISYRRLNTWLRKSSHPLAVRGDGTGIGFQAGPVLGLNSLGRVPSGVGNPRIFILFLRLLARPWTCILVSIFFIVSFPYAARGSLEPRAGRVQTLPVRLTSSRYTSSRNWEPGTHFAPAFLCFACIWR